MKGIPYENFFYGNKDKEDENNHHLFSYKQIRVELIKICGEPEDDEQHKLLHKSIREIWRKMPQYRINQKHHKLIHHDMSGLKTLKQGGKQNGFI